MNVSTMTLNRIVEERAAVDEDVRRALEKQGRPLLSQARLLSDEFLLEKLRTLNVPMDRGQFLALAQRFASADEITGFVTRGRKAEFNGYDEDWIWMAFVCFWERWQPERPSVEMIDDWMQKGYKAEEKNDSVGVARLWIATWDAIWQLIETNRIDSVEEFDRRFPMTNSLFNWSQDFIAGLDVVGFTDPSLHEKRLTVLETLLTRLHLHDNLQKQFQIDLGETHFFLGTSEKGDQLFRQWLQETPRWGSGWIRWSDCYHFNHQPQIKDLARAEQILKEGLAVLDVENREHLMERLSELYSETSRNEEAAALALRAKEIKALKAKIVSLTAEKERLMKELRATTSTAPRGPRPTTEGDAGQGVDVVKRLAFLEGHAPGKKPTSDRVGRNDPCPCGSGKKFKRCCGKNAG